MTRRWLPVSQGPLADTQGGDLVEQRHRPQMRILHEPRADVVDEPVELIIPAGLRTPATPTRFQVAPTGEEFQ